MRIQLLFIFILAFYNAVAQFPPAAGQSGSTAISAEDPLIIAWANACFLERGWRDINEPDSGLVDFGLVESALGPAGENGVVSLGDGGTATLSFDPPIRNGSGWDFAVFENGFPFGNNEIFLELAFVEVSSDGENFVRFPAFSNTDTNNQIGAFDGLQATQLHNLAGKYRALFGTPFDLEELEGHVQLDINQITHVKLIDVVGSLSNEFATYDSQGKKINDPYPTPFPSGGFDLDAVGVFHQADPTSATSISLEDVQIYPNPIAAGNSLFIELPNSESMIELRLYNTLGKLVKQINPSTNQVEISTKQFSTGAYFLTIHTAQNNFLTNKIIIK